MYKIKIKFSDGDSYKKRNREEILDFDWTDVKIAEDNVDRIIQHYEWWSSINNQFCRKTLVKPEFVSEDYDESIRLKLDDGSEHLIGTFWCGYFGDLQSAQVVIDFPEKSPNIY